MNCDGCDKGAEYCMNCNRRFKKNEDNMKEHLLKQLTKMRGFNETDAKNMIVAAENLVSEAEGGIKEIKKIKE